MGYEAVEFITQWSGWLLIIIPFAAGAMVAYQAVRRTLTD